MYISDLFLLRITSFLFETNGTVYVNDAKLIALQTTNTRRNGLVQNLSRKTSKMNGLVYYYYYYYSKIKLVSRLKIIYMTYRGNQKS